MCCTVCLAICVQLQNNDMLNFDAMVAGNAFPITIFADDDTGLIDPLPGTTKIIVTGQKLSERQQQLTPYQTIRSVGGG